MWHEQELCGGIAFVETNVNGFLIAEALPKFLYGNPVAINKKYKQVLCWLWNEYMKNYTKWFLIDFNGEYSTLPNSQEVTSQVIGIENYDLWIKKIDKEARNQVNQSYNNGLKIQKVDFKTIVPILKETDKRHKNKTDLKYLKSIFDISETLCAFYNKKPVGLVMLDGFNKKAHLLKNASIEKYFKLRTNNFLYSESIKWCVKNKYTELNLGSGEVEGLNNFKQSLGSKDYIYYYYSGGMQ